MATIETIKTLVHNITVKNVVVAGSVLLFAYALFSLATLWIESRPIPGFPMVGQEETDFLSAKAKFNFALKGRATLEAAVKQFKSMTFQIYHHNGPALVVPIEQLEEVRNSPDLTMSDAIMQDFFINYSAFKSLHAGVDRNIVANMINRKLTPSLSLITDPVVEENSVAIPKLWPTTNEWQKTPFMKNLGYLVSQVSSRVFLGEPMCRDPTWINIAMEYTIDLMTASYAMRFTPSFLRPIAYHFLPPIHKLQKTVNTARKIIEPEVRRRREARKEALAKGEKIPKHLDSIDWLLESADMQDNFDYAGAQLNLTFAAIHTTSNTLCHLMYDILDHPELIPEMRQEIVEAYQEDGGWKKTTLYKLKLMDSVMKESQRVNVLANLPITRYAKKQVTLSDGTVIPKDSRLFFSTLHMHDDNYYPEAERFDGKRFLNLRQEPGNANKYQFVTTSMQHVGFGHGLHACPGRFFASNEIKLMLAYFLINYDWKFMDGRPKLLRPEANEKNLDQEAFILYKSREPEIVF